MATWLGTTISQAGASLSQHTATDFVVPVCWSRNNAPPVRNRPSPHGMKVMASVSQNRSDSCSLQWRKQPPYWHQCTTICIQGWGLELSKCKRLLLAEMDGIHRHIATGTVALTSIPFDAVTHMHDKSTMASCSPCHWVPGCWQIATTNHTAPHTTCRHCHHWCS